MGARLKVRVLGLPGIPAAEHDVGHEALTLSGVMARLARMYPALQPLDKVLVVFVNGQTVKGPWDGRHLADGDELMLVVPIAGG